MSTASADDDSRHEVLGEIMKCLRVGLSTSVLALVAACSLSACGDTASAGPPTISGHVTVEGTGAPYPGATVEFRNVLNGELHTTTDSTGAYSLQLPPDTYNAFALSLTDLNAGFAVAGTGDKSQVVTVPPSTELDFVAFPIN